MDVTRTLFPYGKLVVARTLSANLFGHLAATLLHDRIPFLGLRIHTRHPAFTPRVKAQLFWRIYESAECRFIRRYLRGSPCALELGSSLGVASAHLASVMPRDGRLLCVEANPELVSVVLSTLAASGHDTRLDLDVLHAAVVGQPGIASVRFLIAAETTNSRAATASGGDERSIEVPGITLSELVDRLNCDEYVLVSDIEGGEAGFILSDYERLAFCRRMVIELHDTVFDGEHYSSNRLLAALLAHGFDVTDQRGQVFVLDNVASPPRATPRHFRLAADPRSTSSPLRPRTIEGGR